MIHRCERCDSPATFHLTEIKGGDKSERHLCEECAQALKVPKPKNELQNLLKSFDPGHSMGRRAPRENRGEACPECGVTYAEFRKSGRFGCPHDYDVFAKDVKTLLERIHGSSLYTGKTPDGGRVEDGQVVDAVSEVRAALAAAVEKEDYEEAARLRDEIRRLSRGDAAGEPPRGDSAEAR